MSGDIVEAGPEVRPTAADADDGSLLVLDRVAKRFPDGTRAVHGVSLRVRAGEFVSLVGPSGCGKSTLLRLAAGIEDASTGTVERTSDDIAFVFQHPTLMPWRTVRRNAELVAELRGRSRTERAAAADAALAAVGLSDFADHRPGSLSGGMRMRAALAQALVVSPRIFLLDEPFSAIDELTRRPLGEDLHRLHRERRFGALFVTHSVAEAVLLSTRVVVLSARPCRVLADVATDHVGPEQGTSSEYWALVEKVSAVLRADAEENA